MGAMHMAMLGPEGLEKLALRIAASTQATMESVLSIEGIEARSDGHPVFREFAVRIPGSARDALRSMDESGVLGGFDLGRWWDSMSDCLLIGCDESTSEADIQALTEALGNWARRGQP